MANVELRPMVSPQLNFGFGGSIVAAPAWQSSVNAFHHQISPFNQPSPVRAQKRRHQDDEETVTRDQSMDRSPTPERPKRAAPKRARVLQPTDPSRETKENKDPSGTGDSDNDIDVGVLLASLPTQSLLPLLTALLSAQPSLKSAILPLIPRPTLDTALQALSQSARKLREAYPYSSSAPSVSPAGFGFGSSRPTFGGFGRPSPPPQPQSGMRDFFVAACMSYMPYFSYVTPPSQHSTVQPNPAETYLFLAALTEHWLSQPPLTAAEWKAWVEKLDILLNHQGGMFAGETVSSWERGLDAFAGARGFEGAELMRSVRDLWLSKVGWLVSRQPMEEL
ncbi:hypothetical protein FB45DRAFT_916761 [Roridomyces roridus]|uniref:Tethering factor for nuclear proteasome STS1 n=1 Tax=Roridomyces roridus TaxID=1738132 RepID=A0AAD7BUA1_9AGAR|nr:hypothetical protein FB45DRAFT_916761 [Roridomyces roridus]